MNLCPQSLQSYQANSTSFQSLLSFSIKGEKANKHYIILYFLAFRYKVVLPILSFLAASEKLPLVKDRTLEIVPLSTSSKEKASTIIGLLGCFVLIISLCRLCQLLSNQFKRFLIG